MMSSVASGRHVMGAMKRLSQDRAGGVLPTLRGSRKQCKWAESIRRDLLAGADDTGDELLVTALRSVDDATFFIMVRVRQLSFQAIKEKLNITGTSTPDSIKGRLHASEWDAKRAAMQDATPDDPGPPW
jgi:hypothetical protein